MAKKWAIREGEPLKVRVVRETERESWTDANGRPMRVRIKQRVLRIIATIIVMLLGASCR